MTHFPNCNNIIKFQTPKLFLYCLVWLNERKPEIVFKVHQNAEMNIMKNSTRKGRNVDSFKIWFGTLVRLHDCSIHHSKMSHYPIHIKIISYKTPKFLNIFWLAKIHNVQKSRFQVTKILTIYIMKYSTTQYRTVDSFKIWFRNVGMITRLFYSTFDNDGFHTLQQ
jgi:hypothetical protein